MPWPKTTVADQAIQYFLCYSFYSKRTKQVTLGEEETPSIVWGMEFCHVDVGGLFHHNFIRHRFDWNRHGIKRISWP